MATPDTSQDAHPTGVSLLTPVAFEVLRELFDAMSAREPSRPAGLTDRVPLLAAASALVLDVMVLGAMVARIGEPGVTPNRAAALGSTSSCS